MTVKRIAVTALTMTAAAFLAAVFTVGCQKSDPTGAFVGIAIPETHVTRWIKDGNSLKEEAEKRGYRAEVQFADASQEIQNRHIQGFLSVGAKLLVVGSIDETIAPAIAEAAKAKVPVIAYDRLIPNSADYDYYITFNNYKVGSLKGEFLIKALGLDEASADAPKLITFFAGAPTDGNAFFFFDGAKDVLNPYIEKGVLKVIGPNPKNSNDRDEFLKIATEGWQASAAKARMEQLLKTDAKDVVLDAVLSPNDHLARAILEVLKSDAKYKDKLPILTGQDAEFESVMSIKNGEQSATVFKNTAKLSEAAIILADQILRGQEPSIPGAILATGNLQKLGDTGLKTVKTYLLDPVLITKENINVPVDAGFYTAAESEALR